MVFCAECGVEHCVDAPQLTAAEVRIAEINANRDIEVARLAKAETTIRTEGYVAETEIEADAQVDEAVVKAEVVGEVLDQVLEPDPEPEPVVVVSDESGGGGGEELPSAEPPEAEPAAAVSSGPSNPWWE
jgi:hypothetical protein